MGWDAGHGRDPRAELLRPEESAATKATADIEDISAESRPRAPDLGRVVQHALLCGNYPLA